MTTEDTAVLEGIVVGALIDQPQLIPTLLRQIDPGYMTPVPKFIAYALADLVTDGGAISIITVDAKIRERGFRVPGGTAAVIDLWTKAHDLSRDLESEIALLAERYILREAFESTIRIRDALDMASSAHWTALAHAEVDRIAAIVRGQQPPVMTYLSDLMVGEDVSVQWCIPRLLPVGTATMLTAEEGVGKSTLLRQIGLAAIAGLDPFTPHTGVTYTPQRVLLIDCEVTSNQLTRSMRALWSYANRYAPRDTDLHLMAVESQQRGLNFSAAHDQAWLHRLVQDHRPTLVVVGPVYRFTDEDLNTEEGVRTWQRGFEPLLAQGISILTEHHAPNEGPNQSRSLRPIGSSAMRRWFAQGIALRTRKCIEHDTKFCQDCRRKAWVESWRGSRDEEARWPTTLTSPNGGVWWERDEEEEVRGSIPA